MHRRTSSLAPWPWAALVLIAAAAPAGADPAAKQLFGVMKTPAALSARAIGSYTRGCLAGGRSLAISGPGWEAMKLQRNRNWGHPRLIEYLQRFATESRDIDGWPGLLIGDLAQPRGGPMLTGHKSHQIGLDADIWYKPKPAHSIGIKERADSSSIMLAEKFGQKVISENWKPGYVKLLKRAASYRETARIFVHPAVKRALCEGAGKDRAWLRRIRPWWLHNYHFHVRLTCPAGVAGCVNQNPPPAGDGCGAQLSHWLKLMASAEKASKIKRKPPKKPRPRRELRLADLPQSCRAVLNTDTASGASGARAAGQPAPVPERRPPDASPALSADAKATMDPNLPWLRGSAASAPKRPAQMPPPARKPGAGTQ
ncbi:MAG: penicillin-insensitive murein endopeptidase [Proteobacteria bacterium]|nr:penicillin-insensitive murein endopeptidase [Pseudomonadota bacterium]